MSSRSAALPRPRYGVRAFERRFEEYAFRGEYRNGGRQIAVPLLSAGAVAGAGLVLFGQAASGLATLIWVLVTLTCSAGALALVYGHLHAWRNYRLSVFVPILVTACGSGLLLGLSGASQGLAAHEPAVLVLATATVAALCRLLVTEVATLTVAAGLMMLITLAFSPAPLQPAVVLAIVSSTALAIGLTVRVEQRERETWHQTAQVMYELRRLRRERKSTGAAADAGPPAADDLFGGPEHATGDVDVVALVNEVLASHRSSAERAGISLSLRFPRDGSARARTNAIGLTQVVSSLISNGIQYGALGTAASPRVLVAVTPVGDQIRISVIDNGVGIASELHRKVFDPYFRAPSVSHRTSGAGLGLYCAARVVQQLDEHRLQLRSKPGHGTRLNVYLPRIRVQSVKPCTKDEPVHQACSSDVR